MDFRFSAFSERLRKTKRKDVALFFGSFLLFLALSSAVQVAFSPGTEPEFDSSSIENRETFASGSSKEIFAFDELEPKESAPPEESPTSAASLNPAPKRKAAPSRISFSFRPDAVNVDDELVGLLRANINARAFREKVTPLSVTVDSERVEPRGQLSGNELIISTAIPTDSEKLKVFVHELGHVVDIHYLKPGTFGDLSNDFYAISWDSYKVKKKGAKLADFVSGYALSNKYEDFAESFAFFVFHNAEFEKRTKTNASLARKYAFFANRIFADKEFVGTDFATVREKPYFWDTTKVAVDTKKYLFYIR